MAGRGRQEDEAGGGGEKGKGGEISDGEEVDEAMAENTERTTEEEEEVKGDEKLEKVEGAEMSDAVRGASSREVRGDVAGPCDATCGVRTSSDAARAVATLKGTR